MAQEHAIEIQNLTKYYGRRRGIAELTLQVPRGSIYGFLGPNGAGKTTTIRLLLGFLKPTFGRARVMGLDMAKHSLAIRSRTGYLPGEVRFFNHLTGYGMLSLLANLRGTDCRKRAEQLADVLDLDLSLKIRSHSRGMRQKLGIIQAMMHEPDVLILDEPTNSLDPLVQQRVYHLLRQYAARGGTVFFSSHIINEVERICTRVAIIRSGRLVADDNVDELRAKSIPHVMLILKSGGSLPEPLPEGLQLISTEGREVHLVSSGPADRLIDFLNKLPIDFLTIEAASLEEVFMRFYRQEKENHVTRD
ncbi:MAG: ABC transporter ATP-binding protein [Phycisphaerae bacterium]